jgi:ABC-type multidrug transport system fused ATPase/permease subunit
MANNMIIALIILAYIASVFLNRWLNYLIYKYFDDLDEEDIIPFIWFIPVIGTIFIIVSVLQLLYSASWFTGKHWKK